MTQHLEMTPAAERLLRARERLDRAYTEMEEAEAEHLAAVEALEKEDTDVVVPERP